MRRVEYPNNTPEQVADYLEGALAILEGLEIDGELRVLAFAKAVDLLAGKQIVMEQVPAMMTPMHGLPGR